MATVSVEKIISTAKSLVGKDAGAGCDIMKWYGSFSTAINSVACCCAGQMYLFNNAGALSMIPGGKTASCGVLAVNFNNAGQLYGPSDVKPGDLVIFSWSGQRTTYNSNLATKGYKTLDHVELCIAVGNTTITTIGANNGGAECDDFQIKTRNKSNISCCCRPKYNNSTSNNTSSSKEDEEMIKYGLTNNAIWSYKQHLRTLKAMGVIKTSVDNNGGFGDGTLKATKEVQKAAGITVDGIVGANTIKAVYDLETKAYNALNSKISNAKKALA
ncbi:MAG: peptidoglycan-binding protein [Ruminococcus sp.]